MDREGENNIYGKGLYTYCPSYMGEDCDRFCHCGGGQCLLLRSRNREMGEPMPKPDKMGKPVLDLPWNDPVAMEILAHFRKHALLNKVHDEYPWPNKESIREPSKIDRLTLLELRDIAEEDCDWNCDER